MQRKVLEYLAKSGNISYACKRAGISRDTFYSWKKEDKLFAGNANLSIVYGKNSVNDLAHTQLIRLIQNGNMQAVRFQLSSCHDDYKPRRARPSEEVEGENPLPITAIYFTDPPDHILRRRISSLSPSPAPSLSPEPKKNRERPKLASTTEIKPPLLPEPESTSVRFSPPSVRRMLRNDDDDDGVEFDGDIIWGKR